MKNIQTTIIIFSIALIVGFIFFYFCLGNHQSEFSKSTGEWSNFSTFMNLPISIINVVIFYFLTVQLYKYNLNKDLEEIRPILSFHLKDGKGYYAVENIGKSVALDVKLKKNLATDKWEYGYNYFTINPGEKILLPWSDWSMHLCAEYKDRNREQHYSYMDGNALRFFKDDEKGYEEELEKCKKGIEGEFLQPPPIL